MLFRVLPVVVLALGLLGCGPAQTNGAPTRPLKRGPSSSFEPQSFDAYGPYLNGVWTVGTKASEKRLIRVSEDIPPKWLTEDDIDELRMLRKSFMDVTEWEGPSAAKPLTAPDSLAAIPTEPSQQAVIGPLLKHISPPDMRNFLEEYSTAFRNRYYKSNTGVAASAWLHKQIVDIAEESGRTLEEPANISVSIFEHRFPQSSIIARFEPDPKFGNAAEERDAVIVGAHLDSVNQWIPSFGRAPGADDDGSGTTTILEAFRVLAKTGYRPGRPVEFHWYAAEEAGLLGSADVAREYAKERRRVLSMMQFDMTGYVKPGTDERVGVMVDHVDAELTTFLRRLVEEYSGLQWVDSACGYGCSDHASWSKAGYRSAFPFEGEFKDSSPYIHSTQDTVETLNFEHMAAFVKIAISYVVELGSCKE